MGAGGEVVFWNLERLFGAHGSAIHAALSGGGPPVLSKPQVAAKVAALGAVLGGVGQAHGKPGLVGMAEIETPELVEQVSQASGLGLVSVEGTPDDLGVKLDAINISLLYDPDRFGAPTMLRSHIIDRTFDTRDVLEVHLPELAKGRSVCVLVNHWPSRLSLESADRRVSAAYYVLQLVTSVVRYSAVELWDPVARRLKLPPVRELQARAANPVVVMGDFNDEPFDHSFEVLNSTPARDEVSGDLRISGRSPRDRYTSYASSVPRLFNPTWEVCTGERGTFYRSPRWRVYDQVLLTRGALDGWGDMAAAPHRSGPLSVGGAAIKTETRTGKPMGFDPETGQGASDHFPIVLSPRS